MYVLTKSNMRQAEEFAHEHRGLSFYSMMDMAGSKSAAYIAARENPDARVCVLCGKGKNGGDGIVVATRLWQSGFKRVYVVLVDGKVRDELAYKMYKELTKTPIGVIDYTENPVGCLHLVENAEVLIDAIFGIGFSGELAGGAADLVITANLNRAAHKYAIDIPSGLAASDTDTDRLAFETDVTLTMIAYKPVNVVKPAANRCGKTQVVNIGLQSEDVEQFAEPYVVFTPEEARRALGVRPYDANKGTYGKLLLLAGSREFSGCVTLASRGAVEAGAGLVTAAFPASLYDVVASKLNEPVYLPLPDDGNGHLTEEAAEVLTQALPKYTVVAAGCGLGNTPAVKAIAKKLLEICETPLILDADALNAIADEPALLKTARCPVLITPHPGEMGRLTGLTPAQVNENRMQTASEFAKKYGVTVLLKGANSVVADPDGRIALNPTGNPGMSRGGSGDVLTGIIGACVPQTKDLFTAARVAAYLHGGAADEAAASTGILSATPTRILDHFHNFLKQI